MLRGIILSVAAVLSLAACDGIKKEGPRSRLLNATVRVEVDGGGTGSGTVVAPRLILTNNHVAGKEGNVHTIRAWIKVGNREYPVTYKAVVRVSSEELDMSLMEISADWPGEIARVADPALTLRMGDKVLACGSPLGKHPHCVSGEVSLPLDDDIVAGMQMTMATAPIAPGNSGGGFYAKNTRTGELELVGVSRALAMTQIGFGVSALPHMAYFIPSYVVRKFLIDHGVSV